MNRPRKPCTTRGNTEPEAWLESARENPVEEPAFFRRLLDATVYVHAPASDDSGKLRLVQFRHPDGFEAIPFFTSLQKAQIAGSSSVRILGLAGWELLTGTLGATLMLDPNDGGAVLYPEEIATLLETGVLARIEKIVNPELHVRAAQGAPVWLGPSIRECLQQTGFVSAAYILETNPTEAWDQRPGLLICLVVDMAFAERAARLVTTAIQPLCSDLDPIIDLTIHDATQPLPAHLEDPEALPVFVRGSPA